MKYFFHKIFFIQYFFSNVDYVMNAIRDMSQWWGWVSAVMGVLVGYSITVCV